MNAHTPPLRALIPLWVSVCVHSFEILQAMYALKCGGKNSHSKMLNWMVTTTTCSDKEFRGILRWFIGLRLCEQQVQYPCATAVLNFIARFPGQSFKIKFNMLKFTLV